MTSQHKTNTHPFYDKLAKDRHSSIFLTSQQNTGTHPFLMRSQRNTGTHPFFMPSQHNTGTHPFFMTSQHNTGTHPFYIGMYIHICTHIYVHIFTSQKECLHIFSPTAPPVVVRQCRALLDLLLQTLHGKPQVTDQRHSHLPKSNL